MAAPMEIRGGHFFHFHLLNVYEKTVDYFCHRHTLCRKHIG